jgi:hypothetical protein
MLVILASRWDTVASAVAARWGPHRPVGIMTPQDLSVRGWRQQPGATDTGMEAAVVQRELIPQKEITGVLTRLQWVTDGEVIDLALHDRAYAAAEMHAFLLSWLSRLKCPVLNPPTPTCLSGPYWRAEQWTHAAARAGIPVHAIRRDTQADPMASTPLPAASHVVTVIGRRAFGTTDPVLLDYARRLAEIAGVALLSVRFSDDGGRGITFVGADTLPALDDEQLQDAALEYLDGNATAS